ncbi:MAG: response regulator transcription factor [Solirubrobacterales bacterium]
MSAESNGNGGAPVILVADDDDDIRALVGFKLEREGFQVMRAADGEEALRLAHERRPDLCVIDMMMPKCDGLGVTRTLKADSETEDVPILLLTARAAEEDIARGLAAGADDYLPKPFSPQDLAARVQQALAVSGFTNLS